jgi:hypothetical protein
MWPAALAYALANVDQRDVLNPAHDASRPSRSHAARRRRARRRSGSGD